MRARSRSDYLQELIDFDMRHIADFSIRISSDRVRGQVALKMSLKGGPIINYNII